MKNLTQSLGLLCHKIDVCDDNYMVFGRGKIESCCVVGFAKKTCMNRIVYHVRKYPSRGFLSANFESIEIVSMRNDRSEYEMA